MSARSDHDQLEELLGYRFSDRSFLDAALRHRSWVNEHPDDSRGDNERLEFLGDAVLDLAVGHLLMMRFPDLREGQLSVTRSQVVSEAGLSEIAAEIDLGAWLMLGRGEERSGGRQKASILADAFEAVVAAVYLDGGFAAAFALADRLLARRIDSVETRGFHDFKTKLQEAAQATLKATPTYHVLAEDGPDHDKRFAVAVRIGNREWARALGRSKKEAEQLAAAEATFALTAAGVEELARGDRGEPEPTRLDRDPIERGED